MNYKIIYVCHSNKGRSPALEAFTDYYLSKRGISNISVESAASSLAMVESLRKRHSIQISRVARKVLREKGLDMEKHLVTYLGDVINRSDLILVTDNDTLEQVIENFWDYKNRAMLVGKYARSRKHKEIRGPHHESRGVLKSELDGYKKMIKEIDDVSKRAVRRLVKERRYKKLSRR